MEDKDIYLEAAIHGNTKYPWDKLTEINAFFVVNDIKKRKSITSCLRHYNKKNGTCMRVKTKRLKKGFIVTRVKDAESVEQQK